jgi:hypothetical protein
MALLRRIDDHLEAAGLSVTIGTSGPAPSLTLERSAPDALVIELGPGLGRIDRWRHAIDSYRNRRALAILTISGDPRIRPGFQPLVSLSTLGTLTHPIDLEELLARLQDGTGTARDARKAA